MTIKQDEYGYIEPRDASHNAAFYSIALLLNGKKMLSDLYMYPVLTNLFRSWIFQYKHPTYKFSNCEDWRKTVYNITKKDYLCGSNGDQTQPALLYMLLTGKIWLVWRILFGYIARLGIACNFQEFIKPNLVNIGFRALRLKPIYWVLDILFYWSVIRELRIPSEESTTRKIRMFLMLLVIGERKQNTYWTDKLINNIGWDYFISALRIYWPEASDKHEIVDLFEKYIDKQK